MQVLPHHKLLAFGVAKEMLLAVKAANIREAGLRDQAMRVRKARVSTARKARGASHAQTRLGRSRSPVAKP
jgi:hypothetical protein